MSTDISSSTRSKAGLGWLLPLLVLIVLLLTAASGFACEVATDKLVYQPGEAVTITGKVWQPQEWVKLTIANTAGTRPAMEFDVTAGSDGTFTSRELIVQEYDRNQMLVVMAKGSTGREAMVAFRVGVAPGALRCTALTPASQTLYGLAPGQMTTCTIEGATDLSAAQKAGTAPVEVLVKGSNGNVPATVLSVSNTTITFSWKAPANSCDSAIVSYGPIKGCDPKCGKCTTFPAAGNDANSRIISNGSVIAPAGFKYTGPTCGAPPQLDVEKLPKNGAFTQGSQVSFRIIVRNTGATTATSVRLTDQLPGNGGLVWQSASTTQGSCVNPIAGNALSCTLGNIAPQGSVTVTVTSTATTPAAACQCQPNLKAVATADGGITAEDYGFLTCSPSQGPPQLMVAKSPKNGTFTSGAQISYIIQVSNPAPAGSAPARNVMLTDQLPGNGGLVWPFVSTTAGSCSIANNNLQCSLGDIAAGATVTVALNSTVTTPAAACQNQPNDSAVATADGGLRAEDWGSLTCASACPQLRVVKTPDNGTFIFGAQLRYSIVVSNPGTAPANNVRLTDTLPTNGGLTWTSVTPSSCTITGNALNCMLGTIAAGGSVTVTVSSPATTPLSACQPQPNPAAIATADNGLTAQDSGSMTCTPPAVPKLKVVKTPDNGTFAQGGQARFTIVVSNPGTATAMNVRLIDQLPVNGGLTWTSVTPTTCTISGNLLNCALGNIAAGASTTVVVASPTTTPPAACQPQPNPVAMATADGGLTAQDSGSLTCTPPAVPQLRVVKTPDNGSFVQGGQARFTIVVSNPGTAAAMNVRLTDLLPANGGLTWTSVTPSTCSLTGNLLDCGLGNIAAGGSVTVTVSSPATTPAAACQPQPNPAAVATADGNLRAQDAGSLTCTPPANPQLRVVKTPDNGSFTRGGQARFTIVVSNPGNATAINVRLTDRLPTNGGLTWTSVTPATCSISANVLNCALGNIAAGGSVTVVVSTPVTTPAAACQAQPNPAAIATADGGLTAQDAGSLICNYPRLTVVKTPDNGVFTSGSQVRYTIVVRNPGTAAATNVRVTDQLPTNGGLTWTSVTPATCSITGNVLNCALGTIAAGASRTIVVTSPATTPETACQPQPNPAAIATADGGLRAQDAGSQTCTPPARPQLRVVKTPDNGSFTLGSRASFTIVVSNPGNATATNVRLTDQLPTNGGLTWTSATPGSCSIVNNLLDCALGSIPAGGSVTVNVSSPAITPAAACQNQPNPAAVATADGGLRAEDSGSLTCIPPPCIIPAVIISGTSWNRFNIPAGTSPVVWVHAHIGTPSGIPTNTVSTVRFNNVSITLNGTRYPLPDGLMIFDPAAPATITTSYDAAQNLWTTRVNPRYFSNEMFFSGAAIPVTPEIAAGAKATLSYSVASTAPDLSFPWQWSAAVYTSWPSDWNQANIQPFHQSYHAGTPLNTTVQRSLIQGPRGGGGSNFTGSWSATGKGVCP